VVQQQARARLGEQNESLQQQSDQLAQLVEDNERLSNLVAQANGSKDQWAELLKLRAEAESLRKQTNDLAMLRQENRQLQQRAEAKHKTPLQIDEERIAKIDSGKNWLMAFRIYANEHQDQFPTNFEQAAHLIRPESKGPSNQFEIVYQGSSVLTNGGLVVLKEKDPWQDSDGKWFKIYGLADGSVQTMGLPVRWNADGREISYDSFEAYEKDHVNASPGQ
jgi:hypothetical protein